MHLTFQMLDLTSCDVTPVGPSILSQALRRLEGLRYNPCSHLIMLFHTFSICILQASLHHHHLGPDDLVVQVDHHFHREGHDQLGVQEHDGDEQAEDVEHQLEEPRLHQGGQG